MPSENDMHRAVEVTGKAIEAGGKVAAAALKAGPKILQSVADALKNKGLLSNETTTGLHLRHHVKGSSGKTHSGFNIRKNLFG